MDVAIGTITIDPTNQFVTFDPADDYVGKFSFTYTATDADGADDTATVYVEVTPVNDPPVAVDDIATTYEGVGIEIPVLVNDTDIDSDQAAFVVTEVTIDPAKGTATISTDGKKVIFVPAQGIKDEDVTFTYKMADSDSAESNLATVIVTVQETYDFLQAINDPTPESEDETEIAGFTTPEDTEISLPVMANDIYDATAGMRLENIAYEGHTLSIDLMMQQEFSIHQHKTMLEHLHSDMSYLIA